MAKGGQGGRRKRPIRQVKTNSGGRKKGAKSILGSNHFGKVGVENFSFLACTLLDILHPTSIDFDAHISVSVLNLSTKEVHGVI